MFYSITTPEALEYLKYKAFLAHTDIEILEEENHPSLLRSMWYEDNK